MLDKIHVFDMAIEQIPKFLSQRLKEIFKLEQIRIDKILEKPIRLEILKNEVQKLVSPIPLSK